MNHKHNYITVIVVILATVLISGCTQQTQPTCESLAKNFDAKIDSISITTCDKWADGSKPIWMGGTLISISKIYNSAYERNEFTLTFQGFENQGKIYISAKNNELPYEIGKFYKFDLGNKCKLFQSMASSGMFSDPNLNVLEHLAICDINVK